MSEFEASRAVHASPERVFAVASDPALVEEWVPAVDHAEPAGADLLEVTAHGEGTEMLWRAQEDQRRVEWGSKGTGEYAGWLQVHASAADDESEVAIHLSFLGDQPEAHGGQAARDVETRLGEALGRLAELAERG